MQNKYFFITCYGYYTIIKEFILFGVSDINIK